MANLNPFGCEKGYKEVETYSSKLVEVWGQLTEPVRVDDGQVAHEVLGRLYHLVKHYPATWQNISSVRSLIISAHISSRFWRTLLTFANKMLGLIWDPNCLSLRLNISVKMNSWVFLKKNVLVQTNFRQYYFYFLPDYAQTHLDHWKVLDKFWCQISFKSENLS